MLGQWVTDTLCAGRSRSEYGQQNPAPSLRPKTASVTRKCVAKCPYGIARPPDLLPRSPEPRRSLRRPRLRGLHLDRHLLPADLPHAPAQVRELPLLRVCRCGAGGGLPALPALPSADLA